MIKMLTWELLIILNLIGVYQMFFNKKNDEASFYKGMTLLLLSALVATTL